MEGRGAIWLAVELKYEQPYQPINMAWFHFACLCFDHSVMRRVITLINQLATATGTTAAVQSQAESANQAAKKYMEDNELLKQVSGTGSL